jgi:xanthine/uracil permease
VALLIMLAFAFSSNLAFESRAESRLHEALAASGMSDPGAFLVKSSLEAASEALVRMPALALFLSCIGCFANAWITRARSTALAVAWLTPLMFVTGTAALWHASSLERAARPPFVVAGVLLAGVALSGAHPIWSVPRRAARR